MTDNKLADALDELCDAVRVHDRCRDQYNLNAISEAKSAIFALAEHDAPDKCFCDRMYPDSNPNASCGDCPTRDYGAQPAPTADGAVELPPLPEPTCLGFRNPCGITQLPDMGIYGYTSDQVRAYARAAELEAEVLAEREACAELAGHEIGAAIRARGEQ